MSGKEVRTDRVAVSVGAILFACFALSFGDALIKGLAGLFDLWQVFALRSLLALPVFAALLLLLVPRGRRWPEAPIWAALRSGLLVLMWSVYYLSLPHLPLSVAAAAYYTLPLCMTLMSGLFLHDRIGTAGWIAVAVGFAGVAIILRPSPAGVNGWVLLPVLAAFLYAAAMVMTRAKCRAEHPLTLATWLVGGFFLAGVLIGALSGGLQPDTLARIGGDGWRTLAIMATAMSIGGIGGAIAYQNAAPAIVGIFDFSYVGFAVIWGILLFSDRPDAQTLTGMALIVAAGCLAIWRRV